MRKFAIFVALMVVVSSVTIQTFYDADPQQCIEEKCPNQWASCQKDSKCIPALQDCQKKCGTKQSCWTLCLPTKGSQAAIDVAKCAQKNNCLTIIPEPKFDSYAILAPQDCIREKCPTQLQACQKDTKCFPALQDCEKECVNNTACWTTCLSKKGDQAASDLYKCILDNHCFDSVEVEAFNAEVTLDPLPCVKEKCPNEWAACEKDSKCVPTIQDCNKKCGTGSTCWTFCLGSKGDQPAIDVAKCAQKNKCLGEHFALIALNGPEECILQYCKSQEETCANDRRCIMVLDECDRQCNTNLTCWDTCLNRSRNKNATDYVKCIIEHNCLGESTEVTTEVVTEVTLDPLPCVKEKCPNEWAACEKDSKCVPTIEDCNKKCGTGSTCWTFCLGSKGDQPAIDVAKCAQKNKCLGVPEPEFDSYAILSPQDCIQEKCPNQLKTCEKDTKCFPSLADCSKECANNTACWTTCLAKKGDAAASDLYKCVQDNHCFDSVKAEVSTAVVLADPQQCIEQKCPNQWAACQKDSKCIPALQDCEKKCGTKESCWTLCLPTKGSQAAIDVAKCAQANKCLGLSYAFESCMSTSCFGAHTECLSNWECRNTLRKCRTGSKAYDFHLECLLAESKISNYVAEWYTCAGDSFCL